MSVQCFYKMLDEFAPMWAVIIINSVGVFLSFEGDLEDKKRGMGIHPIRSIPSLSLSVPLFSPLHLGLGIEMDF